MNVRTRLLLTAILPLALFAAACGSSGDASTDLADNATVAADNATVAADPTTA